MSESLSDTTSMKRPTLARSYIFLSIIVLASSMSFNCGGEKKNATTSEKPAAHAMPTTLRKSADIECDVFLDGTPPQMKPIKMNADKKCLAMHRNVVYFDKVIVNRDHRLENVFLYLKEGLATKTFPIPSTPVVLKQHGCMYEPHVLGIMTDQPLEIINDDPVLHNIHALSKTSMPFNIAQPKKGMKIERSFSEAEVMVPVKCEVHSWMKCYIGVLNHPFFAVSDSNGKCVIKDVPPGTYVVSAWHETYGTHDQAVEVKAGETTRAEFHYASR